MRNPALTCLVLLLACRDRAVVTGAADRADAERATLSAGPPFPARVNLARWVRGGPGDLGCWMERNLSYHDPRWNCSTAPATPAGDSCEEGWRAGPQVPDPVARRMHPLLRRVALSWERGALQALTFTFDPDVPPGTMARILGIGPALTGAVARQGPGQCDSPCYEVVVFAPAAPDCSEDEDEEDGEEGGADE